MSSSDFEQRVRGEISAEEYVRRLEERVRERNRDVDPLAEGTVRSAKDFAARYFPKSFRTCRHCRGTGVER